MVNYGALYFDFALVIVMGIIGLYLTGSIGTKKSKHIH